MRRAFLWFALFFVLPPALYPHSLTISAGINNFMFNQKGKLSQNTFTTLFNAAIDGEFSTFSRYKVAFENDPVLQNFVYGNTTFNLWLFRLGIGAFFDIPREGTDYIPGVIGSLGIEIIGGFSAYVEYGQNAFTDLDKAGGVNLNYGKIEAAIWLPNILCRVIIQRKSFAMMPDKTYLRRDSLLRYQLTLDFSPKPSPILFTLGGGSETLEMSVEPAPNAVSPIPYPGDDFETYFALFGFSYTTSSGFTLFLNAEAPVPVSNRGVFFKAVVGFSLALPDF
jgi:hypothetical protein